MFRNQSVFVDEDKKNINNLTQEKDYKIDDVPVHTMEKDIKEIENPSAKKETLLPEKPLPQNLPVQRLSDKQQSSPFLNSSEKAIISNESSPKPRQDYSQINKMIQPKIDPSIRPVAAGSSGGSKKVLIFLSFFIIVFAAIGTYYFITTRKDGGESIIKNSVSNPPKEKSLSEKQNSPSPVKTDNQKHIVLDIATANPESIKKAFDLNRQSALAGNSKSPVEFVLTDKNNNRIAFSDFAKVSNLALPNEIMSSLDSGFSVFLFNDDGNSGIGIVIDVANPTTAKAQLAEKEGSLNEYLKPLLPYTEFLTPAPSFESAQYKEYSIRYQNLISPKKLSIDYAFKGDKLIIATTKLTMESILDKLAGR